jgi:serine/threonine-protein kinase HipA
MATFGDQTVLVVERFDRAWMDDGAWIARLPQEDFCQALGFSPKQKYEHDGGPGMAKCLQLLTGSADAQRDKLAFQLTQLAFWLMAATDGHAKNYSIFLQPGDTYVMTPLYDILSMWPYNAQTTAATTRRCR